MWCYILFTDVHDSHVRWDVYVIPTVTIFIASCDIREIPLQAVVRPHDRRVLAYIYGGKFSANMFPMF